MRADETFAELTASAGISERATLLSNSSDAFPQLVQHLGLDPKNDFVFSNLREVDFTASDLRGFDFTGADLRCSYGTDIQIDDTTVLTNADVTGSCFATYKRERDLFASTPGVERMYETLKSGDPYEVSEWIHSCFGGGAKKSKILRETKGETAAVLCQKLLTDDIDLTKRTDLIHHLRSITGSKDGLRELLLDIFARHLGNAAVLNKFVVIAGDLYKNDPVISQAFLTLTTARDQGVREIAFRMLSRSRSFAKNLPQLRSRFLSHENLSMRQSLLRSAAIKLGRQAVSAVNLSAKRSDVPLDQILDYNELLDEYLASEIAERLNEQESKIAESLDDKGKLKAEHTTRATKQDIQAVMRRQEEVMCSTPVINLIFASDMPVAYQSARNRLAAHTAHLERKERHRISRVHSHRAF